MNEMKYREVEPLKKGDRVVMHTCIEARNPKNYGKVWTCKVDEYEQGEGVYHQKLIFLEGFSGSFMTDYLQKVNDETAEVAIYQLEQLEPLLEMPDRGYVRNNFN